MEPEYEIRLYCCPFWLNGSLLHDPLDNDRGLSPSSQDMEIDRNHFRRYRSGDNRLAPADAE